MAADLEIALGELRGEFRALGRRLDSQDAVIGRIDERTRAIELRIASDEAVDAAEERAAAKTEAARGRFSQFVHAVVGPFVGTIAGTIAGAVAGHLAH